MPPLQRSGRGGGGARGGLASFREGKRKGLSNLATDEERALALSRRTVHVLKLIARAAKVAVRHERLKISRRKKTAEEAGDAVAAAKASAQLAALASLDPSDLAGAAAKKAGIELIDDEEEGEKDKGKNEKDDAASAVVAARVISSKVVSDASASGKTTLDALKTQAEAAAAARAKAEARMLSTEKGKGEEREKAKKKEEEVDEEERASGDGEDEEEEEEEEETDRHGHPSPSCSDSDADDGPESADALRRAAGLLTLAEKRAAVEAFGKGGTGDKKMKNEKKKKKNRPGQRARRAGGASGVGALPPPPPLPWEGGERVGAGAGAENKKKQRKNISNGGFSGNKRPRIAPPRPFSSSLDASSRKPTQRAPSNADPGEGLHPSWAARRRAADAATAAVAAAAGKAKKIVFDDD